MYFGQSQLIPVQYHFLALGHSVKRHKYPESPMLHAEFPVYRDFKRVNLSEMLKPPKSGYRTENFWK
jgi:hypothetical protein